MSVREATMLSGLLRHKGWLTSLDDKARTKIVRKLLDIISDEESTPRDVTSATKALGSLEKNDIDKAKVEMQQALGESLVDVASRELPQGLTIAELRKLTDE